METYVAEAAAQTSIIVRALEPQNVGPMPTAAARYLIKLRPAEPDRRRADELAARARLGQLTEEEETEVEERRRVGKLFEAMKLVAHLTLQNTGETL